MKIPSRVHIREVSPRDGLQAEPQIMSTTNKIALIERLVAAGFTRINATSFVHPKVMPQMADAADVAMALPRVSGVIFDATVPNQRGAERAVEAKLDAISVFVSASEIGSRANVGQSSTESMASALGAIRLASAAGLQTFATVSKAFGSPFGEIIEQDQVMAMAGQFVEAGVTGVAFGDTSGEANPAQVHAWVTQFRAEHPDVELALHFHDTRGLSLANVIAAMDAGATHFDAALGGIGGSPFTKNSSGNVATEDLVFMCESMGIDTGVDLNKVLDARDFLEDLLDYTLPGKLGQLPRQEIGAHS